MKHTSVRILSGVLTLICLLAFGTIPLRASGPDPMLVADLNTTLEPGVLHSWVIGPSSSCGGYVVEVTPRHPSTDGAHVQTALVRPEYNGDTWNDVLRVQIPAGEPPLRANVRVYTSCELEVASQFEATLIGGEWMGWGIGPASMDRGFIVEVTPLEPSNEGAYVEKALVQEEFFMGEWQDVLRVQIPIGLPDLRVQIRIYTTAGMTILGEYDVDLQPGVWTGTGLRPSTAQGGYIVEINPLTHEAGEFVQHRAVQPEYNGRHWNDVLRMMTPIDQPPLRVQARVYVWGEMPHRRWLPNVPVQESSSDSRQ